MRFVLIVTYVCMYIPVYVGNCLTVDTRQALRLINKFSFWLSQDSIASCRRLIILQAGRPVRMTISLHLVCYVLAQLTLQYMY